VLRRKTSGSVVCPSCGSLVGVNDDKCYTCGRSNPGLWGFAPMLRQLGADLGFVPITIGASVVLYALTLLMSGSGLQVSDGGIGFLVPSQQSLQLFGLTGAVPVFYQGRWFTLLSATWLHGNLLHILFNMLWVRDLGPATADVVGPSRTVVIYVLSGVTGFLCSSAAGAFLWWLPLPILHGAAYTLGASASIFGLLGALVHYGRRSGSTYVHQQAMRYAVVLFVFGLIMPGVDNYAHLGGFLGGYATSALFNPLTRERGDHLLMALACLLATFLSIAFSVLSGLQII
jgi:rhomboid protease GluP